jgi:hypothetical protein
MLSRLKEVFLAAVAVLVGWLFYERSKRKRVEAKLENAEYQKEDALLAEKQKVSEADIQGQKNNIQKLKDAKVNEDDLSPEEVEDYWNKK